jgi:hypothetical protein
LARGPSVSNRRAAYKYAAHIDLPNDAQRMKWLAGLIGEGHERQIVISHDTGNKAHLVRYGGCGYRHILHNIVPRMRSRGFKEEHIHAMLVDTPKRDWHSGIRRRRPCHASSPTRAGTGVHSTDGKGVAR